MGASALALLYLEARPLDAAAVASEPAPRESLLFGCNWREIGPVKL